MYVHESLPREIGWIGWLAIIGNALAWADIAFQVSADARAPWWIVATIAVTILNAVFVIADWRRVKRRRATISRITSGGSRLVTPDDH
jgi:hypothetical protein